MPTIFANEINQNFEIHGDGLPLVFIHGLDLSLGMWNLQVEYFRKFYKVLVYDLRGHGMTECTERPYSIALFSEDLYWLLNEPPCPPATTKDETPCIRSKNVIAILY